MKKPLSFILLLGIGLGGCHKTEQAPAYISVSKYKIAIDSVAQGTTSQKISDVWITTSNTSLGAYEMPARIPVLAKGPSRIFIEAGVKENGISVTRDPYPFFKAFDTTVNLEEKNIDSVVPVFRYKDQTKFGWLENFDGTNPGIMLSSSSMANYYYTHDKDSVFEGDASLAARIDDSKPFFECQSKTAFTLPRNQPVWLEVNYRTEVPVEIGVYSISSSNIIQKSVSGLNPIDHWNKIYINLSKAVSEESSDRIFSIYIGAIKRTGETGGKLMIDNIKLLYLE